MSFIQFMNFKYKTMLTNRLKYYDDYILFLYEVVAQNDKDKYYEKLENDIRLYSDYQTGNEREGSSKEWKKKKENNNQKLWKK